MVIEIQGEAIILSDVTDCVQGHLHKLHDSNCAIERD